ncbi:hypothetical protein BPO_1350 [Bergeyella porcorum]|uniref:Porphobilinogen deaminase C-terminal domain-containing protein n=1 Tax=Bergeyella porcorum TaxID=1735111 RepID=A0AAU0EZX3_9FLAO
MRRDRTGFLANLRSGCTAPIGAFAEMLDGSIHFVGRLCSLDGKECIEVEETIALPALESIGKTIAEKVLQQGGKALMASIKEQL